MGAASIPMYGSTSRRRRLFLTPLLATAVCGCAVNEHGLVNVKRWDTPTATITTLSAIGAHLSTHSEDFGLTIGWVERTYAAPKPSGEGAARDFTATLDDVELEWHRAKPMTVADAPKSDPRAHPILVAIRRGGLALDANPQRVGVMLGLQQRAALIIPADGSTIVLLRLNLHKPEETTLMIGKD